MRQRGRLFCNVSVRLTTTESCPAGTTSVVWQATKICGVCGAHQEIGIDAEGDIVFVG